MTDEPRLAFLLDVDNTLLDNDAAKEEIDRRLRALLGQGEAERFWALYEEVRSDTGVVSFPLTLARFDEDTRMRGRAPAGEAAAHEERTRLLAPLRAVWVKQGKYAAEGAAESWQGADIAVDAIGELRSYSAADFLGGTRAGGGGGVE